MIPIYSIIYSELLGAYGGIHNCPKGISAMWNANTFVRALNSGHLR